VAVAGAAVARAVVVVVAAVVEAGRGLVAAVATAAIYRLVYSCGSLFSANTY